MSANTLAINSRPIIRIQGVLPCNVEAERRVLGAMLQLDGGVQAIDALKPVLHSDCFYRPAHGSMYDLFCELHSAGIPVAEDLELLARRLDEAGIDRIDEMSAIGYVETLRAECPTASIDNALYFAEKIIETARIRAIILETANRLNEAAEDIDIKPVDLLEGLRGVVATYSPEEEETDKDRGDDEERPFPDIQQDFFVRYMDLFRGNMESPASYHFFCFATAVGMMLGRNVYVHYPWQLYPNLFIVLVGRSGIDRKTTALKYARKLAIELAPIQVLPTLSSYEGLLESMSEGLDGGQQNIDPARMLICMSELNSLLNKARNENLSNLIPGLCDLYDCPEMAASPTKVNPIRVERPFLSILSGIQPGIIEESIRSGDIHGGFAGRFIYVLDRAVDSIPWPREVDKKSWNRLLKDLSSVRDPWTDRGPSEIELAGEAMRTWEGFYHWHRQQNPDRELLNTLTERIPGVVLKLGMMFCALDDLREIYRDHLEDAIAVGEWLMGNAQRLFSEFGQSKTERVENRIVEVLEGGRLTRRQVQQKIGGRIDSGTFARALGNVMRAGQIEETRVGKRKFLRSLS